MRKSSPRVIKSYPKGTKSEPKGVKRESKVTNIEPKGAKREAKGRQIVTNFDLRRHEKGGSRKRWEIVVVARPRDHPFLNNCL